MKRASSEMWRRVDIVLTDVSEEHIASIFRVEFSSTLKMEEILSSETSVNTKSTRRNISEDAFFIWKLVVVTDES
jgi:hypothetical protein